MPEEIEIDTDKLRETIDDEIERTGSKMLRWVSLTTAILAAVAAVASLRAGDTVNEALALKSDATRIQAQASDQWAYYQAKGIKGAVTRGSIVSWKASGHAVPADLEATAERYDAEQKEIQTKAKELESERDAKEHEAAGLLEKHHHYAAAVALFQVAIALGAVSALTRVRLVWFGSLVLGALGLVMFAIPLFSAASSR
jgi:Domain of unknown function (DUF4337)